MIQQYQALALASAQQWASQLNATNYANQASIGRFDAQLNETLATTLANLTRIAARGAIAWQAYGVSDRFCRTWDCGAALCM